MVSLVKEIKKAKSFEMQHLFHQGEVYFSGVVKIFGTNCHLTTRSKIVNNKRFSY